MTTLIVGCGYVGTALAERLVRRERVLAMTRTPRALPEGVEPLVATLPAPELRMPEGIRRVVYAVAPGARTDDAYRLAYPEGLRSVLAALDRSRASLERIILVSSTAVYAEDEGRLVDSRTPFATGTAERIREAERDLADASTPTVVLRASGIYGPGRDRIVREIREGRVPGDPCRVANRVHRDDLAAAIEHALFGELEAISFDVSDDASVPMGEVFAWIALKLGVELDASATAIGETLTGKRIDNTPLRASGFTFRYPTYREGYGELITRGG